MKQMKASRITALLLVLSIVVGALVAVPFSASAYSTSDKPAEGTTHTGTPLPDGATVYDGTPATSLPLGSGTADDPYQIADAAEYMYFRTNIAGTATANDHFILTGDIYLNDAEYGTSGKHTDAATKSPTFAGVLDGDGHTIYNLYGYSGETVGLFGTLTGTVKNLNIDGARLIQNSSYSSSCGTIAATNAGTIENVHVKNLYLKGYNAGGIAGFAKDNAVFADCSVDGVITSVNSAAGIAGSYQDGSKTGPVTFTNCVNNATVTSTGTNAGGMIAYVGHNSSVSGVNFIGCVNNGDITAKSNAAGISANHYRVKDYINFDYCINKGTITTTATTGGNAGGILGHEGSGGGSLNAHTYLRNCSNYGAVSTNGNAGGLVGRHVLIGRELILNDCVNYGTVDGVTNVGGLVGCVEDEWDNGGNLRVNNCANYGNVGAAGTSQNAGGITGKYAFSKASIVVKGFYMNADVTGINAASAIAGAGFVKVNNNSRLDLTDAWAKGTITATDASGQVAACLAVTTGNNTITLPITGSGFDLTFSAGGASVDASTVPSGYDKDGNAYAAYPVADTATFDADALAALNAAATANGYNEWVLDATYGVKYYVIPLVLSNEKALNHGYNGDAVEASYMINDETIKSVEVTYYKTSDLTAPLASAPAVPGEYRVVLQGKNEGGANQGEAVTCDYTITKGAVRFVLTSDTSAFTSATDYSGQYRRFYTTKFNGAPVRILARVEGYEGSVPGELLGSNLEPTIIRKGADNAASETDAIMGVGTYYFHYVFEENDLYKKTTYKWRLTVEKGEVSYPAADAEGRWTVPTIYNGEEQKVVFNSVDGDADSFDIVLSGDIAATNATADGVTLTATATLALKEEYAADLTVSGEAPTYEVQWRIEKAPTYLKLFNAEGNEVADPADIILDYTGETRTYTVKQVDANGTVLNACVETITVPVIGMAQKTVNAASANENYQTPTSLTVSISVATAEFDITVSDLAGKDYDGTPLTFREEMFDIDAPSDAVWDNYVVTWEKWDTYSLTWEIVPQAIVAGTYRLHVTCETVDTVVGMPIATAEGYSPEVVIAKITPVLGYDIPDEYVLTDGKYVMPYDGTAHPILGILDVADQNFYGAFEVTYQKNGGTPTEIAPSAIGTYTVTVSFAGNENYNAATAAPITIEIAPVQITLPADAADYWDYDGPFTYNYGDPYTVGMSEAVGVYSGLIGIDIADNVQSDAGVYTAYMTIWTLDETQELTDANGNPLPFETGADGAYIIPLTWEIEKLVFDWEDFDIQMHLPADGSVYTGEDYMDEIYVTGLPDFVTVDKTEVSAVSLSALVTEVINADTYSVSVTFRMLYSEDNVEILNYNDRLSGSFSIGKASYTSEDYDLPETIEVDKTGEEVDWEALLAEYIYNPDIRIANLQNAPVAVEAGIYRYTVALTGDAINYYPIDDVVVELVINEVIYDMSDYDIVVEAPSRATYNGRDFSGRINVTGVPSFLSYTWLFEKWDEATETWNEVDSIINAGKYRATACFTAANAADTVVNLRDIVSSTITVDKAVMAYPNPTASGRWTIPTTYTGAEQSVVFNFLEGEQSDAFVVTYGGDYRATEVTPEGTYLTASVTLALSSAYAENYTFRGVAPTYETTWRLNSRTTGNEGGNEGGDIPDSDVNKNKPVFCGASMTLGNKPEFKIYAERDQFIELGSDVLVYFVNADTGEEVKATVKKGRYTAAFEINASDIAKEMNLYIKVCDTSGNQLAVGDTLTYAPTTYLVKVFTETKDKDLKNLLKALFTYAAEAEGLVYKTSEIKKVADAAGILLSATIKGDYTNGKWDKKLDKIAKVAVDLVEGLGVSFRTEGDFTSATTLTVRQNGKVIGSYEAEDGVFYLDEIHAGMLLNELTLTFSGGGVQETNATFVMGNYLSSMMNDPTEGTLVKATIAYMIYTRNYGMGY